MRETRMRGLILAGAAALVLAGCATNPENRRAFLMVSMNGVQRFGARKCLIFP